MLFLESWYGQLYLLSTRSNIMTDAVYAQEELKRLFHTDNPFSWSAPDGALPFWRLRQNISQQTCSSEVIYAHVMGRDRAMYHRSGGHNFEQLCELIGQTAEVQLSEIEWDSGWGDVSWCHWMERVTIREFLGATTRDIYDEGNDTYLYEAHPRFTVEGEPGDTHQVIYEDLWDIRPAD